MMRSSQSVLWLALVLVTVSGCKKKPKTVAAKATAPTITAPISAAPIATKPEEAAPDKPPAVATEPPKAKAKPKPKPPKKVVVKAPPAEPAKSAPDPTTVAKSTPPRIVLQPATPAEGQPNSVVPDMTHTEEAHHRQTTEQLMLSTETNLKSLRRVLSPEERSLLQQVQLFMTQSREATQSQDLVRAHNLALKAHLLSDELVR
jgi:hypothetical protein